MRGILRMAGVERRNRWGVAPGNGSQAPERPAQRQARDAERAGVSPGHAGVVAGAPDRAGRCGLLMRAAAGYRSAAGLGGRECDPSYDGQAKGETQDSSSHFTNRVIVRISSSTFLAPSCRRIASLTQELMWPFITCSDTWSKALRAAVSCWMMSMQ